MMAAQAMGADDLKASSGSDGMVTACESYLPMVKLMRKVLRANGMDGKVRLINKRSDELEVGKYIQTRADVLVGANTVYMLHTVRLIILADHLISPIYTALDLNSTRSIICTRIMKKTEDAIANSAMIVYRRRNPKSSSISKVRANKRRIEPQMIIRDHVGLQVRGKKRRIKRQRIIRDHDAKGEPNIMNTPAMARALEVQANLTEQFPSMVKFMRKSHVSGGFWLNLAKKFTDLHLTHYGSDLVLEDENGGRHNVVYLKDKSGLSGGWRAFATDHKLMYGDVLIFQLIKPYTFKVYIIRASLFAEVDAAIGLLKLDMDPQPLDKVDRRLLLASNSHKENDAPILILDDDEQSNKVHSDSESDFFSEYVILKFEDVKTIKDFRVPLDGLNYEIPNNVREKYYELCRSQNMFLHEKIGGDNIKLVTGMISETVNVADAVRQVKSTTSVSHIQSWDITLKSFEELGMTVGFLRSRIHELLSLDRISKAELEANRRAREDSENEMKGLKRRLGFVKDKLKKLDGKIDALVAKDEERDAVLQKIAGAPW